MIWRLTIIFACLLLCSCDDTSLPNLPDPSLLDDSETKLTDSFESAGPNLLANNAYDQLDQTAADFGKLTSPFATGNPVLDAFYDGLTHFPDPSTDSDYDDRIAALKDWVTARPDSIPAKLALAYCYYNQSWHSMNNSNGGNTVDNRDKAWDLLEGLSQNPDRSPTWYDIMIQIANETGKQAEAAQMTTDGIATYPNDMRTYADGAFYRDPQWGGADGDSEAFARECANKIGGDEGDVLYARIARIIWINNHSEDLFTKRGFSWSRVKNGMEIICNRYPNSERAANYFFAFAAVAHKRTVALYLMDHMGSHYDPGAWPSRDYFDQFCGWVRNPCTPW